MTKKKNEKNLFSSLKNKNKKYIAIIVMQTCGIIKKKIQAREISFHEKNVRGYVLCFNFTKH